MPNQKDKKRIPSIQKVIDKAFAFMNTSACDRIVCYFLICLLFFECVVVTYIPIRECTDLLKEVRAGTLTYGEVSTFILCFLFPLCVYYLSEMLIRQLHYELYKLNPKIRVVVCTMLEDPYSEISKEPYRLMDIHTQRAVYLTNRKKKAFSTLQYVALRKFQGWDYYNPVIMGYVKHENEDAIYICWKCIGITDKSFTPHF